MARHMTRPRTRTLILIGAAFIAVLLGAMAGAYALDSRGGPRTIRNLEIAGHPAGNLTPAELSRVVSRLRNETEAGEVTIDLPDGPRRFFAADLGISVDTDALESAAMEAGEAPTAWSRFRNWLGSFTTGRQVPLSLTYEEGRAEEVIGRLEGLVLTEPTEPRLVLGDDQLLMVREGSPGVRVDEAAIVDRLGQQVEAGGPFDVDAPTMSFPPSLDETELATMAEDLNELTAEGVTIRVAEEERHLGAQALRLRLDVVSEEGAPVPTFDLDSLQRLIAQVFREVQLGGEDPVFDVVDDEPVLVEEGSPPLECCRDDAAETVAEAVLDGRSSVTVEPEPSDDPRLVEWAQGVGVVEKVAEFTTNHACCEGRVSNIQRFADIVRGAYLVPGESLSLNEYVGERTSEKGFVPAGTIIRGHLVPTVGGGVSQFATTMFNAAFFAGFDFITYQSHSLYISRYPYGREATISWPAPDLEFENTTEYPALIWTSYTDTSITVSIYSTQSVEVEQTGQSTSAARQCTRVDTFRRRTYEDGREVEDSVFATYRPSEGFDCNGNPTDRPDL